MKSSLREPPESSHFGGVVKTKMCNGKINDLAHSSHNFNQNGACVDRIRSVVMVYFCQSDWQKHVIKTVVRPLCFNITSASLSARALTIIEQYSSSTASYLDKR